MTRSVLLLALCLPFGCTDPVASNAPFVGDARLDAAMLDARMLDRGPSDEGPIDRGAPDRSIDANLPDQCPPAPAPPAATGPLPDVAYAHAGIDAWEADTWARLKATAQADPAVHFIATFDHTADALVIETVDARLEAQRVDGRWAVTAGALADVFPSTDAAVHGSLPELLAAFEPYPDAREDLGYVAADVRVGGLPPQTNSWPDPLERLGTIFDDPHAPDGVVGLWPWARGGAGTHGGLGVLQSRASLMLAGKGVVPGQIDGAAALTDVAPTVLAALGAATTGGTGPDGLYEDGLYLRRQDGRVLWEALDGCVRPKHVVVVLFDGLLANELNHQVLSPAPDVELPTLRALAEHGAVYRHGAVAGFPSMSAPGHMTIGTGVWPGHHGILNNSFFDRARQARVEPLAFASDPGAFARDPHAAFALITGYVPAGVETLAAAAHRAFGPWDPDRRTGAYVAVINDIPVGDADFTTADFLTGERSKGLRESQLADELATVQATTLLGTPSAPVPTILQVGFASTDSVGESHGPHAPRTREVLRELDGDLGRIVASYDRAGALDDTLFVIVSDHGMELQDPARAGSVRRVLQAGDIKTSDASFGFVYLRSLVVETRMHAAGVEVTVRNHDDGTPVEGVELSCPACDPTRTDAEGRAIVPSTAGLIGTHPDFNPVTLP